MGEFFYFLREDFKLSPTLRLELKFLKKLELF